MKKIKISQLSKASTVESSDELIMLQQSTIDARLASQTSLSKRILSNVADRLRKTYKKQSVGNMLTAFSTWALGPNWSIDANGNLVNNTPNEKYGHTTTNTFSTILGKTYIINVNVIDLNGVLVIQPHTGINATYSYSIVSVGSNFFMLEGSGESLHIRIYGDISNKIHISSFSLSEIKMSDIALVIETELRNT